MNPLSRQLLPLLLLLCLPVLLFAQWTNLANGQFRRYEGQTVLYQGKLFAITGFKPGLKIESSVEVYDPATNTWTLLAPMPLSKYETDPEEAGVTHMGVGLVGDSIWIVGGRTGSNPGPMTEEVWIYDIAANVWTAGPDLPLPIAGGGMAVLGRKLYVLGGFTTACNGDQSSYHLTLDVDAWLANPANTWVNGRTPMPNPRNHMGTTAMGGKIYVFGGQLGHDCCASGIPCGVNSKFAQEYNPLTDTWRPLPNLPYIRSHVEAATFPMDGKLYVSSSVTGATIANTTMEYDPNADSWSINAALQLPTGILAPIMRPIGNQMYLLSGGYGGVNNPTDSAKVRTYARNPQHTLGFTQDSMSFLVYQNGQATGENFYFTLDGAANYQLSLAAPAPWLTLLTPSTGNVSQVGRDLRFEIDVTGLPAGDYTASVILTGSGPDVLNPASTVTFTADTLVISLHVGPSPDGVVELSSDDSCEEVEVGSSVSRLVSLTTPGGIPVNFTNLYLSNTTHFQLVNPLPTGLVANGSALVEINFSPLTSGTLSTELILIHDGPFSPDTLLITCTAVPPCVLPADWVSTDLGTPLFGGAGCVADNVYYLRAAGTDIWSSADQGHFMGTRVVGDGEVIVRISHIDLVSTNAKAGLMMRTSLSNDAANVYIAATPADGVGYQYRSVAGANTNQTKTNGIQAPRWLRLTRTGTIVQGDQSVDGITWTKIGGGANPQSIALGDTVWVGLAMTSKDPTQPGNAIADNFSLNFTPISFPVELISFEGQWLDRQVALRWESASELAFDRYEITRMNAQGNFERIGQVPGTGQGSYLWIDQAPPIAPRHVYRLSMVDLDGTVTYSPLVELSSPESDPFILAVNDNSIEINWLLMLPEVEIRLIDLTGRTMLRQKVRPQPGATLSLPTAGLAAGWYHVQMIGDEIFGKSVILR